MSTITELRPGTRLAGYTVESVLGRGATGIVYAALDSRLGRPVALKVLAPAWNGGPGRSDRLLTESRRAASVDHPNIIPIYEAGDEDGVSFIAMRLVGGTDLRELLAREGPLPPRRALAIAKQVADGLDAAHARGLLHRDVKPANILLAPEEGDGEHVYLSDFGLAVGGAAGLEASGFAGTAAYASPEQIAGRPGPRSDLYSLACVLHECLTGAPPFRDTRLFALLWAHVNEPAPRPSERHPGWPPAVDDALLAGLRKEPEDRPATCSAFVAGVERAFGIGRSRRGARFAVAAVVAVTALATALVTGLVAGDDSSPAPAPDGPRVHVVTAPDAPGGGAALGQPWSLAVDGRGTVYVSEVDTGAVLRIDPDGTHTTLVDGGEPGVTDVALAVDPAGVLHLVDHRAPALHRLERVGSLDTVAGDGTPGTLAAGASTVSPHLCARPEGLAFDPEGRAYVACETAHRVIRIEPDGSFTTIAGSGRSGFSGDGGPASEAALERPSGVAVDRVGNVYIADQLNNRIRVVRPDGTIDTVAGTGRAGLSDDGWRATAVDIWAPNDVAVGPDGSVYFTEPQVHRVRKVDPEGIITTVAGTGRPGRADAGEPADGAPLRFPVDIDVGADGSVYVVEEGNRRVLRIGP